jgi:Tol biopolymer transport system component
VTEQVSLSESGVERTGVPSDATVMPQVLSRDETRALVESTSPLMTDVTQTKTTTTNDLFLRDREVPSTTWLTLRTGMGTNANVHHGHLSTDGSTVVFDSTASDLVPDTPADGVQRIFVHDVATGTRLLLSGTLDPEGHCSSVGFPGCSQANSVSADGRYVVFTSKATNLPAASSSQIYHVYLHDRDADGDGLFDCEADGVCQQDEVATVPVDVGDSGTRPDNTFGHSTDGAVSADGTQVAFSSNVIGLDPPDENLGSTTSSCTTG